MLTPSFSCSLELPRELQIKIWSYAITNLMEPLTSQVLFPMFAGDRGLTRFTPTSVIVSKPEARYFLHARRLPHLLCLERWKHEVDAITIEPGKEKYAGREEKNKEWIRYSLGADLDEEIDKKKGL